MFRALTDTVLVVTGSARFARFVEKAALSETSWKTKAARPADFASQLKKHDPDVVIFYIDEDPDRTLSLVSRAMAEGPVPAVIFYTDAEGMKDAVMKCLETGAVEALPCPADFETPGGRQLKKIQGTLESARLARLRRRGAAAEVAVEGRSAAAAESYGAEELAGAAGKHFQAIGIAISTGGPQALSGFLPTLPAGLPVPVLIVQHIIKGFIDTVAQRLDRLSALRVKVAADGEKLEPGVAYLAPDGRHMKAGSIGDSGTARIFLSEEPAESLFRPSADELFRSMAEVFGGRCIAVMMTGMGRDGVAGLKPLKRAGALTIAQDAESSVIFGMANVAVENELIDEVVPLGGLGNALVRAVVHGREKG